jgi:hypothetical protein
MTQGKRKNQINFSSRMAFIAFIGITLCFIWAIGFLPEPNPPTEGIPHNHWVPTNKEDKDWTGTSQGKDTTTYLDEDVMWITGDGDTIWE